MVWNSNCDHFTYISFKKYLGSKDLKTSCILGHPNILFYLYQNTTYIISSERMRVNPKGQYYTRSLLFCTTVLYIYICICCNTYCIRNVFPCISIQITTPLLPPLCNAFYFMLRSQSHTYVHLCRRVLY